MSHGVEKKKDGTYSMFSGEGITPWHGFGKVIPGLATAEEALDYAGLNWKVNLRPAYQEVPIMWDKDGVPTEFQFLRIPDQFSATRDSDNKSLGVVTKSYKVYQNSDAFSFLNTLTDAGSGDAVYSTAGSLLGGRSVFMTMKIGDRFNVGDNDAHDLYIMATNSHNAKQSFTVSITPIRAVCKNTVTLALARAKTKWSLRHKVELSERIQDAREVLEMSFKYEEEFEKAVQEMMAISVTKQKFFEIIDSSIPESPQQHDKDVDAIMNIWENEPTVKMGGGEGNAWGAFNAATFWTDHKEYRTPASRFNSIIGTGVGTGIAEKMRPMVQQKLLALAK